MADRIRWAPAVILGAGCCLMLLVNRQRDMPLRQPLSVLPTTLDGYHGVDQEIAPGEQSVAGMDRYLLRSYGLDSTMAFSLYVGYYDHQTQGRTIHSPKNCLPGAGWEAVQASTLPLETTADRRVTVNRYLLQNGDRRALVLYWYQGRGRVAANEYRVKWELLRDAALRGRSEEALVRIVVPLDPSMDGQEAEQLASRVAGQVIPDLFRALPA